MNTHTFHVLKGNPCTYNFEEKDGCLQTVTICKPGFQTVVHNRPGHTLMLHDLEVNIGSSLVGLGSNHPELGEILSRITRKQAA